MSSDGNIAKSDALLRGQAIEAFVEIAAGLGLGYEFEDDREIPPTVHLKPQGKLPMAMSLSWEGDTASLSCEIFWMEFWIGEDGEGIKTYTDISDILSAIMAKVIRMRCYHRRGSSRPYKVKLERRDDAGVWSRVYTYCYGWPRSFRGHESLLNA